MATVGAAKFKEQCLSLLDNLDPEGLVITKHGRPVALLVPYERRATLLIGSLARKIAIRGDLLSTGAHWDAHAES